MSKQVFNVAPLLAFLFLLFPMQSWSQDMPEGVTWDVVHTYNIDAPGIDKVQLGKFTMEPGKSMSMPIAATAEFCTSTQGQWTVENHDLGTITTYATGSRWSQKKGHKVTVSNRGEELAVQWVYELYAKE